MDQCVDQQIVRLDRLSSLGRVHPFEEGVEQRAVVDGMFRAPPAHRMRIASLVTAVAGPNLDSSPITRDTSSLR